MLIYFSATGNTKHLVEEIAYKGEKIIAVDKADNIKEINLEKDDRLGVLSPTYAGGLPENLKIFLENLVINYTSNPYTFYIGTCGGSTGFSSREVREIFIKKGIELEASFSVKMPDAFLLLTDVNDKEKISRINKQADREILDIKQQVDIVDDEKPEIRLGVNGRYIVLGAHTSPINKQNLGTAAHTSNRGVDVSFFSACLGIDMAGQQSNQHKE